MNKSNKERITELTTQVNKFAKDVSNLNRLCSESQKECQKLLHKMEQAGEARLAEKLMYSDIQIKAVIGA